MFVVFSSTFPGLCSYSNIPSSRLFFRSYCLAGFLSVCPYYSLSTSPGSTLFGSPRTILLPKLHIMSKSQSFLMNTRSDYRGYISTCFRLSGWFQCTGIDRLDPDWDLGDSLVSPGTKDDHRPSSRSFESSLPTVTRRDIRSLRLLRLDIVSWSLWVTPDCHVDKE